tara:strand:+ start:80 stop:307 length:228 start_codon:yes stop_codon:yes gene_type:complete
MQIEKIEPNSKYFIDTNILKQEITSFLNKHFNILGDNEGLFIYTLQIFKRKYPFISNDLREIINKEIKNLNNSID